MSSGNQWYVDRRLRLIDEFGGRCSQCGSVDDLQFAHVKPTPVVGLGRGRNRRVLDVVKHPEAYVLLCRPCHAKMDGFVLGSSQALNRPEA